MRQIEKEGRFCVCVMRLKPTAAKEVEAEVPGIARAAPQLPKRYPPASQSKIISHGFLSAGMVSFLNHHHRSHRVGGETPSGFRHSSVFAPSADTAVRLHARRELDEMAAWWPRASRARWVRVPAVWSARLAPVRSLRHSRLANEEREYGGLHGQ